MNLKCVSKEGVNTMKNFPLIRRHYEPYMADFDFERLFEDFFRTPFKLRFGIEAAPAVDVYEKDNKVIAKVEIPGAKPEDIKVSLDGNTLTIKGEKKEQKEIKKENYYRAENVYGAFKRVIELPADVTAGETKAEYKDGVLKIELSKDESRSRKEIKIDVK